MQPGFTWQRIGVTGALVGINSVYGQIWGSYQVMLKRKRKGTRLGTLASGCAVELPIRCRRHPEASVASRVPFRLRLRILIRRGLLRRHTGERISLYVTRDAMRFEGPALINGK